MKRKHQTFFPPSETNQSNDLDKNIKKKTCTHHEENIIFGVNNSNQDSTLIVANQTDIFDNTSNLSPNSREPTPEYNFSTPPSTPPREAHYSNADLSTIEPKLNRINTVSIWDKPVDRRDSQLTQKEWDEIDNHLREKAKQENQRAWDDMKNANRVGYK